MQIEQIGIDDELSKEIGIRLKDIRTSLGISQTGIAEKLGIKRSIISRYETGYRAPTYSHLIQMARHYSVSTDYLLGLKQDTILDMSHLSDEQKQTIKTLAKKLKTPVS